MPRGKPQYTLEMKIEGLMFRWLEVIRPRGVHKNCVQSRRMAKDVMKLVRKGTNGKTKRQAL